MDVSLEIYNAYNTRVKTLVDRKLIAGSYIYRWDGDNENGNKVVGGIYFYKLETNNRTIIQTIIMEN